MRYLSREKFIKINYFDKDVIYFFVKFEYLRDIKMGMDDIKYFKNVL